MLLSHVVPLALNAYAFGSYGSGFVPEQERGFLLLFLAVNIANMLLARDTGAHAWLCGLAVLSTSSALIILCVEVEENPATRHHLWILAGMVAASFAIEAAYRGIMGRRIHLVRKAIRTGVNAHRH